MTLRSIHSVCGDNRAPLCCGATRQASPHLPPNTTTTIPDQVLLQLDEPLHPHALRRLCCLWPLRFPDTDDERRYQLYQEHSQLRAAWRAGFAGLVLLTVAQTGMWTRMQFVYASNSPRWSLMYMTIAITIMLAAIWASLSVRWHQQADLDGKLQRVMTIFAVWMTGITAAFPSFVHSPPAMADVTELLLLLLVVVNATATSWDSSLNAFCASAAVALLAAASWTAAASPRILIARDWHPLALFVVSLITSGVAVYDREQQSRKRFLHLRRLLVENLTLSRKPAFESSGSTSISPIPMSRRRSSTGSPMAAPFGESRMENVLRTLSALKKRLGESSATIEIDFVIEALTGEHDLFQANHLSLPGTPTAISPRSGRRKSLAYASTPHLDAVDAAGWLSLLQADQRQRRRGSSEKNHGSPNGGLSRQLTFPPSSASFSPRRPDSGFLKSVLSQVDRFFKADDIADEWSASSLIKRAARAENLDVFALGSTSDLPLSTVLLITLESHSLFLLLPLRVETVAAFAREIERRYRSSNPYHNALHAASVVWDVNFFLRRLERPVLSALQIFSALVAAAVHDVNHPGVTNAFLVATGAPLAIQYSDDSVLERMHLAECFQASAKDGCDIFQGLSRDQRRQSRQLLIAMVLATDLSGHVQHVNRLKSKSYARQDEPVPADLVLQSIVMMADLGHAFKPFDAHNTWSLRVTDEFFRQGDTERERQLPVSPLCDRERQRAAGKFETSQIGFLEVVVLPLYLAVMSVVPLRGFDGVLDQIRSNADEWRRRANEQAASGSAVESSERSSSDEVRDAAIV